jgi:hypothetical protein
VVRPSALTDAEISGDVLTGLASQHESQDLALPRHQPCDLYRCRVKSTPNGGLLVVATTKAILKAAPQGRDDQFTKAGQFDAESQKVESYWSSHVKLAAATN